jgi:DNA polymerase-3 subunit epsilon
MTLPNQRSVLLDTETTGLDPSAGDRIIEIAAIELLRDLPTGRVFHHLIDPERDVPEEATRIHGFTRGDLTGKPRFAEIVDDFLAFLGDAPIVAHNAPFDFGFIDAELQRLSLPRLHPSRMIDTLVLAKTRFPGLPNSLSALCSRFNIDQSERVTHNALLDCRLLSAVYVELTGGLQRGLLLTGSSQSQTAFTYTRTGPRTPRPIVPTRAELETHAAFLSRLKNPLWLQQGLSG